MWARSSLPTSAPPSSIILLSGSSRKFENIHDGGTRRQGACAQAKQSMLTFSRYLQNDLKEEGRTDVGKVLIGQNSPMRTLPTSVVCWPRTELHISSRDEFFNTSSKEKVECCAEMSALERPAAPRSPLRPCCCSCNSVAAGNIAKALGKLSREAEKCWCCISGLNPKFSYNEDGLNSLHPRAWAFFLTETSHFEATVALAGSALAAISTQSLVDEDHIHSLVSRHVQCCPKWHDLVGFLAGFRCETGEMSENDILGVSELLIIDEYSSTNHHFMIQF